MQKKVYIFLTLLFFVYNLQACVFTKSLEIELFKAVLSENMYESLGNGIKIKNPTIGKLLKEILNTSLGLVLLKQLSVLLPKLKTKLALQESSHVKINLMGIHGCSSLSAMVINNEWVINIQNIPVPRKIAVKCSKGFKFYTIQIPPYIVLSHELLHCFLG